MILRFLKARSSSLRASASSVAIRLSSISTIVTSLPKWSNTDANSTPITPPPSTISRGGTASIASRPVESTQRGPSMPSTGGRVGLEPVAITACVNATVSPPSTPIVLASVNWPRPSTTVIPLAFSRPPTPLTERSTISSLFFWTWAKSSATDWDVDPEFGEGLVGVLHGVGALHPRLGRDAAHVEAGAAQATLLDDGHAQPELGRADGGRIATGSSAEYRDVDLDHV